MTYIKVIPHQEATGELKDIYDDLIRKRRKLAAIHMIQSLNPQSITHHMDLYMGIMFGKSPLKRAHREMIAVVVSAANNCEYCIEHHAQALLHFWKDPSRVDQLSRDYTQGGLTAGEKALCDYAYLLTTEPWAVDELTQIAALKEAGWEDRAILDAALVVAYFNFVNRLVLGLGVHLEEEGAGGYAYD
ncbi:MAG: peroxidase-related enzyme [Cyclobacteriaceae bacterium]|nr:peroxidase-related enzyme [Cyclobacteriaceae bacterium]